MVNVNYEDTPRGKLTHVAGWTLGKTLGRGAYAHVRHAAHFSGRTAACKILPSLRAVPGRAPSYDQVVDAVEAHKEVVLLKALNGGGVAGVVGLEGVIEEDGWTYVFLSLYPYSLSALGTLSDHQLVPLLRRLLHTVNALHKLRVSHEDIKRANVMVDRQSHPVLVDLGFSLFWPERDAVQSVGGTLDYSSPDKAMDALYEPRANDVWALGITVCRLANLPHPYLGREDSLGRQQAMDRLVHGAPQWPWDAAAVSQGGKEDLIMCMLERDPVDRWTVPELLLHPYLLQTTEPDPPAYVPVPLDAAPACPLSPAVFQDLCFLAFTAGQMTLCETPWLVDWKLLLPGPCWEKRWACMLQRREQRVELDWVDEPAAAGRARTHRRGAFPRALRPIQLTPAKPVGQRAAAVDTGKQSPAKAPPAKPRMRGAENLALPAPPPQPRPRRKPMKTKRESLLHPPPESARRASSATGGAVSAARKTRAKAAKGKPAAQLRTVAPPAAAKHARGVKPAAPDDKEYLGAIHDQLEAAALRNLRAARSTSGTTAATASTAASDVAVAKGKAGEPTGSTDVKATATAEAAGTAEAAVAGGDDTRATAGKAADGRTASNAADRPDALAPPAVQTRRRSPRLATAQA